MSEPCDEASVKYYNDLDKMKKLTINGEAMNFYVSDTELPDSTQFSYTTTCGNGPYFSYDEELGQFVAMTKKFAGLNPELIKMKFTPDSPLVLTYTPSPKDREGGDTEVIESFPINSMMDLNTLRVVYHFGELLVAALPLYTPFTVGVQNKP